MTTTQERYRIVSNGLEFRIEQRKKFLWWWWWDYVYTYTPAGGRWPAEYRSAEEAKGAVEAFVKRDRAQERGWEPI